MKTKTPTQILRDLIKKVEIVDGHWFYRGDISESGYGKVMVHGIKHNASRVLLELLLGVDLPKDMDSCHRCSERACVAPAHLYAGTRSQNMLDAVKAGTHINARKKHCSKGHSYVVRVRKDGTRRICLICRSEQDKARRAAKKALKCQ